MISQTVIGVSIKRVYLSALGVDPEGRECNWATVRNIAGDQLFYGPKKGPADGAIPLGEKKTFEAPGTYVWSEQHTKILVENGN